jgi:hypothetical protein
MRKSHEYKQFQHNGIFRRSEIVGTGQVIKHATEADQTVFNVYKFAGGYKQAFG